MRQHRLRLCFRFVLSSSFYGLAGFGNANAKPSYLYPEGRREQLVLPRRPEIRSTPWCAPASSLSPCSPLERHGGGDGVESPQPLI